MRFVDMKELTPYRVTKPSTDTTFSKDDIIWLSSNGDINSLSVAGWITPSECDSETLDFEVEKEKDFEVLAIKSHEICRRKANADGCDCCKGDAVSYTHLFGQRSIIRIITGRIPKYGLETRQLPCLTG